MIQGEISWLVAQRGLADGSAENAGSSYRECLSLLTAPGNGLRYADEALVILNCIIPAEPTAVEPGQDGKKK